MQTPAPGLFFDLQVNGTGGRNFTDAELTPDSVAAIAAVASPSSGLVGFCATIITAAPATVRHACRTIRLAAEQCPKLAATIPAIHLEGPWISPAEGFRGAHPEEWVQPPSWDQFQDYQDAAGGRIRLVTLAPERPGALRLIEKLTDSGVVVALGHTAADGKMITDAVAAGARLSTHLGNGCPQLLPRHDNPILHQLIEDRLQASFIADGHHLPLAMIQLFRRMKGVENLILISDSSPLAGLPDGDYSLWGQDVQVNRGCIRVAGTQYLAGSHATLPECVAWLRGTGPFTPADFHQLAWVNPRRLLGLPTVWP
ncbi:MAG: N-acetylglucosamine-6-phosphate deacetylase [Gemmataceae bacterium]